MDAIAQWDSEIAACMEKGMPRARAIREIVKSKPELHRAFVLAHNDLHGRPGGRFEPVAKQAER